MIPNRNRAKALVFGHSTEEFTSRKIAYYVISSQLGCRHLRLVTAGAGVRIIQRHHRQQYFEKTTRAPNRHQFRQDPRIGHWAAMS
jgi:hypothetical protein